MARNGTFKPYYIFIGIGLLLEIALLYWLMPEWRLYCQIVAIVDIVLVGAYMATNLEELRETLRRRITLYGLNTVLSVLVLLAILVLLNFLSSRHHKRWDITQGKIHTLSEQSIKVLQSIDKSGHDVEIYCFFQAGDLEGMEAKMKDLLDMYMASSQHLKVQYVDPAKNPAMARQFRVEEYNTAVIRCGAEEARIEHAALKTDLNEEAVTNALIKVSRVTRKTVYFLTGHGEAGTGQANEGGYSHVKEVLEKENYFVKELMLLNAPGIPADCAVLVVAGPKVGLTPPELKSIDDYLVHGGRALIMVNPQECPGIEGFLLPWGVRVGDDVIVDRISRVFGGDELTPLIGSYDEQHAISKGFRIATFYPLARSVDKAEKNDRDATVTVIGRTGDKSWAETDVNAVFEKGSAEMDPAKDHPGPVSIIVAATAPGKKKDASPAGAEGAKAADEKLPEARLVTVGNSRFADNSYYSFSGNGNLFLNMIAWLAQQEDLISIRPSTQAPRTIALTRDQATMVFYLSVTILPQIPLMAGIVIWWRRRND